MRIDLTSSSMPNMMQSAIEGQSTRTTQIAQDEVIVQPKVQVEPQISIDTEGKASKEKFERAIDSMNEFFTINNSELKFVLHEGLDKYFAQLINKETDEVIREIPSKKVLDVFYEMQKLVGMIVDKKI